MTISGDHSGARRGLLSINAYHYPRGGADIVYLNHAALMEQRGWINSFSSMHHPENIPCDDAEFFADEIDFEKRGAIGKTLIDASRVVYSLEARRKIARLLDERRVDVAHAHNIYHHQSPSVLDEVRRRGIPIVLTAHDLKLACPSYTMLNSTGICERCKGGRVWNVAVNRCIKGSLAASSLIMVEAAVHKALKLYDRNLDRIVAPSQFYRQKLIEWGWSPEKIVHIRNFVDQPIMPPSSDVGGHVVYFGRLSHEKGLATLIRASALSGVSAKIVGRGPQEATLRALAEELSAPVQFLGFLRGEALWSVVDAGRAIVLPSEWYENGPMSVIEAFGRGKPLIGARIGGIPELIEEGITGWSFSSGDVDDLAALLARVSAISSGDLRQMAFACQAFAQTHHSADAYFAQIDALYADLLDRRS